MSFTSSVSDAAIFTLTSAGGLLNNGYQANTDEVSPATVFFDGSGEFPGSPAIVCSLNQGVGGPLVCAEGDDATANIFQFCPGGCETGPEPCSGVALGNTADSRCTVLTFDTVASCT